MQLKSPTERVLPISADDRPEQRREERFVSVNLQLLGIYTALVVLGVVLTLSNPYFLTLQNMQNVLIEASTLALIGAGLTVVMIAGEIDLAFATMQAFAGSLVAVLMVNAGLPWPIATAIAVTFCTLVGVGIGVVTNIGRLPTFITTLAGMGILQGAAYLMTNGSPIGGFPAAYLSIANGRVGPILLPIWIVGFTYLALHFMLTKTKFGLQIFAVGGNPTAAGLVGISRARVIVGVLAVSSLCASVAGVIITARLNAGSGNYGPNDLLPAIAGVIIGGTSLFGGFGTLAGTLGGILIIVVMNDGLVLLDVNQFWHPVVVGLIIFGAVLLDQLIKRRVGSAQIRIRLPQRRA